MAIAGMRSGRWWRCWSYPPLLFDKDGEVNQTERVLALLFALALCGVAAIALYAVSIGFVSVRSGFRFLLWSLLVALAAWLSGGILGMLFGLPSVVELRIADGSGATPGEGRANDSLGYRESTNLEQIADWVTKILIGLTLTQYDRWQRALEIAFARASAEMLPGATQMATPAAIIAITFVANGFLAAYLIMRRYFITEMIKGKLTASEVFRKIEEARKAGLLQDSSVTKTTTSQVKGAVEMATIAASLAPNQSQDAANTIVAEVRESVEYPDDPWRGKFGGTNEAGGCMLQATVTPLDGSTELFTVRLSLIAGAGNRIGQSATFYLHPTFGPEPKKVAFGQDGVASLELIAFGAFTVGVLLETGERLELNLAALAEAPEPFRVR